MPINFRDRFSFLFGGGRGILPNQVDWDEEDTELDGKIDGRTAAEARAGNTDRWPPGKLDLSSVEAQIDHLSDVIAHGPNVGMETTVNGTRNNNVITFDIPASMRAIPGDYDIKMTLDYEVQVDPLVFRLAHAIRFAVAGTGALAGEFTARTYTGGQATHGTYHITRLAQAITAAAAAIRVTATAMGYDADDIDFLASSHITFTLVSESDAPDVTANPTADATATLEKAQIGDTVFQVQVGRHQAIGTVATYDEPNNRLTTDISGDFMGNPELGDTVIFQLPDTLSQKADALTLRVQLNSELTNQVETNPLENSHGVAVAANELQGGGTLEAILVLPDGNTRKWRMIEPPLDLTQAQVEASTGAAAQIFGVVSGERLNQAIRARIPNFARNDSTADVPYTRLPDLAVFKSGSRRPQSGGTGDTFDDRVSGEHVLWWDTQLDYIYVHDGGGHSNWQPLTFGSAQFLVGSQAPLNTLGTPNSVYMEITRDAMGNVTNWYVWVKNASNEWVNRFEVPIQSDADINAIIRTSIPAQTGFGAGITIVHQANGIIDFALTRNNGFLVVLPDSNGTLRDPNNAEFIAHTPAFDVDGNQYIASRRYVGGTAGTLATIAEGDTVTRNSVAYRFAGFHHSDALAAAAVTTPQFRDVYMTLVGSHFGSNIWRFYDAAGNWITTNDPFGHHTSGGRAVYRGIVANDTEALHNATTVGDIYAVGSGDTFLLRNVTAVHSAGTPQYYWRLARVATGGEISEANIKDDDGTIAGLITGRRFEAAFSNKFSEVADETAALAASSTGDTTLYWWPTT